MDEERFVTSYNLRLTPSLYQQLKELAKREHRSINAQIIQLIEAALAQKGQQSNEHSDN